MGLVLGIWAGALYSGIAVWWLMRKVRSSGLLDGAYREDAEARRRVWRNAVLESLLWLPIVVWMAVLAWKKRNDED
jgi:hypothetical protein